MAEGVKIAARNQKAFHEYFIDEKFEAGIELTGTEVKSIRLGTLSLKEAWCQIKDGQLFIRQMHIAPYEQGNIFNKDPLRPRRLLMHKREIMRLYGKVKQDVYKRQTLSRRLFSKHCVKNRDKAISLQFPQQKQQIRTHDQSAKGSDYIVLEMCIRDRQWARKSI